MEKFTRRRILELSLLGGSAALLAACTSPAPAAPTAAPAAQPTTAPAAAPTTAPAAAAPTTAPAAALAPTIAPAAPSGASASGGTLTPLWGATFPHTNPFTSVSNIQWQYQASVFSSLLTPTADKTRMDTELADVTAAPDGSSYTFKLNPNARFHDGQPVTADDVAFTYMLALNADTKSNRLSRLSIIKGGADYSAKKTDSVPGIVVVDPQTIRFDMEFPTALFLVETDLAILPKHILGSVAPADLEKHPFMFDSPIGSGPYKAVQNLTDQSSELAANPDFYRGKPKIDKIVYRIVKQADAAQIALERGEVDYNAAPSGSINLAPDALSHFLAQPSLFMVRMPNPVSQTLGFNLRTGYWQDKRVRQAMAYAIDRKKIIDSLLGGIAEIVNSPIRHPWVNYKPKNDYAYDPDKAKQLLTDGGWDFNRTVNVSSVPSSSETDRATRAAIQAMLEAVGVQTTWQEMEASVWAKQFYEDHTHDMVYIPATNFIDPALFLDFHYKTDGRNGPGYGTPEFDALIEKGRRAPSQEARAAVYQQIGDQLNEDQPWIWLWSLADMYVFNRRVNIPFITAPATNPTSASDVPLTPSVQALPTWYYRPEEWTVKA
ncbi:MAG: ABC transporter substrate-binding protein [Chloroflexi bacterium]|nr:ABC transporter substrate-binding protein [Chloroflexota bacterium]